MDSSMFEGRWNEIRGAVRERWGRLTNSDLETTQGQMEKLIGLVQDRYGYSASRARREVTGFLDRYGMGTGSEPAAADSVLRRLQEAVDARPWAVVAAAIVLVLVAGGLVLRPFART